jgi:hypothetical protein
MHVVFLVSGTKSHPSENHPLARLWESLPGSFRMTSLAAVFSDYEASCVMAMVLSWFVGSSLQCERVALSKPLYSGCTDSFDKSETAVSESEES